MIPSLNRIGFYDTKYIDDIKLKNHYDLLSSQKPPIDIIIDDILQNKSKVYILKSTTGSGKSTVFIEALFRNKMKHGIMICTQQRIAIAEDTSQKTVNLYPKTFNIKNTGFKTGKSQHIIEKRPGLYFMTTQILNNIIMSMSADEFGRAYPIVIIDEAHEPLTEIIIAMMLIRDYLLKHRNSPFCPLFVFMSATLDPYVFGEYLEVDICDPKNCGYVTAPYNHEIVKHHLNPTTASNNLTNEIVKTTIEILTEKIDWKHNANDILIFLPGLNQITQTIQQLNRYIPNKLKSKIDIISYMRNDVINRTENWSKFTNIEHKNNFVRIIISTNLLESAANIPTLKYVIISGWAKRNIKYPYTTKPAMILNPIVKSSLIQQIGRIGRFQSGDSYLMFDEKTENILRDEVYPSTLIDPNISLTFLQILLNKKYQIELNQTFKDAISILKLQTYNYVIDLVNDLNVMNPPSFDVYLSIYNELIQNNLITFDSRLSIYSYLLSKLSGFYLNVVVIINKLLAWNLHIDEISTIIALYEENISTSLYPDIKIEKIRNDIINLLSGNEKNNYYYKRIYEIRELLLESDMIFNQHTLTMFDDSSRVDYVLFALSKIFQLEIDQKMKNIIGKGEPDYYMDSIQEKFLKVWKITPDVIPTVVNSNVEDNLYKDLKSEINNIERKLDNIPNRVYNFKRNLLDKGKLLVDNIKAETPTGELKTVRGGVKQLEILRFIEENTDTPFERIFHGASFPNGGVIMTNKYYPNMDWFASSYIEENEFKDKKKNKFRYLTDEYGVSDKYPEKFSFGNHGGNVLNPKECYKIAEDMTKYFKGKKASISWSDIGISTEGDDENREEHHIDLIKMQLFLGCLTLEKGGAFAGKMFSLYAHQTRSIMYLMTDLFDKVFVVKPFASRVSNREHYHIGIGYHPEKLDKWISYFTSNKYLTYDEKKYDCFDNLNTTRTRDGINQLLYIIDNISKKIKKVEKTDNINKYINYLTK